MVPRYARPAMVAIWEPEARYKIWFEIEAHATQKLGELGVVPASGAQALWDWWATNPVIDVDAIDAIEAVTKHDVIAFLTWVAENVGEEARFMHQGMTSSDVLDTCLAVMQVLHEGLADSKYRPCPLLVKYVEAGWLGRKTQRGFYDYRGEKPVPTR